MKPKIRQHCLCRISVGIAMMLGAACFSGCCSKSASGKNTDVAAHRAAAYAKSISPDLIVREVERESTFGKMTWSVEGEVRGRDVEIEFDEGDDQPKASGKAIGAK